MTNDEFSLDREPLRGLEKPAIEPLPASRKHPGITRVEAQQRDAEDAAGLLCGQNVGVGDQKEPRPP